MVPPTTQAAPQIYAPSGQALEAVLVEAGPNIVERVQAIMQLPTSSAARWQGFRSLPNEVKWALKLVAVEPPSWSKHLGPIWADFAEGVWNGYYVSIDGDSRSRSEYAWCRLSDGTLITDKGAGMHAETADGLDRSVVFRTRKQAMTISVYSRWPEDDRPGTYLMDQWKTLCGTEPTKIGWQEFAGTNPYPTYSPPYDVQVVEACGRALKRPVDAGIRLEDVYLECEHAPITSAEEEASAVRAEIEKVESRLSGEWLEQISDRERYKTVTGLRARLDLMSRYGNEHLFPTITAEKIGMLEDGSFRRLAPSELGLPDVCDAGEEGLWHERYALSEEPR